MGFSLKKAFKSVLKSPFNFIKSAGRGDLSGMLDASIMAGSMGTIGNDGILSTKKVLPTMETQKLELNKELAKQTAEEQAQKKAADDAFATELEKKRKSGATTQTIYAGAMKKPLGGVSNILG